MTPNLGQGACQAIEDAVVLAACPKKHDCVEPALLEYERRRIPFVLLSEAWLHCKVGLSAAFADQLRCLLLGLIDLPLR